MKLPGDLRVAEAYTADPNTADAAKDVASRIVESLGGSPDLAVAFFTPEHIDRAHQITDGVNRLLDCEAFIGCSSPNVIGGGAENVGGPGMSLWAARLPGSRVQAFDLQLSTGDKPRYVRGWPDVGAEASAVLLADPKSFPIDPFLTSLREGGRYPTLVGGLLSTPPAPCLLVDGIVKNSGAVGFVLDGAARLEPVISQGCRPVGPAYRITRCEENIVLELDGEPAYLKLENLVDGLPEEESTRFRKAPHVGLCVKSGQQEGDAGSYLVRGILSLKPQDGGVAIAEKVENGMLLQFHARDGLAAHQDLKSLLRLTSGFYTKPAGALLFDCMGRGPSLFGRPDHDIELVHTYWPGLAVSGFHASGEIGPLSGAPYIHGFTASMGLLVQNSDS